MHSKSVSKCFAAILVCCLLATALAGSVTKPSAKSTKGSQKQIQQQQPSKHTSDVKKQNGQPREKRQVDEALLEEDLLDEDLLDETDLTNELGFDGTLRRVKRQGMGGRRDDRRRHDDDDSSDSSDSSDDDSSTTDDDSDHREHRRDHHRDDRWGGHGNW